MKKVTVLFMAVIFAAALWGCGVIVGIALTLLGF